MFAKRASVASLLLCPLWFVLGVKGMLGSEGHARLADRWRPSLISRDGWQGQARRNRKSSCVQSVPAASAELNMDQVQHKHTLSLMWLNYMQIIMNFNQIWHIFLAVSPHKSEFISFLLVVIGSEVIMEN